MANQKKKNKQPQPQTLTKNCSKNTSTGPTRIIHVHNHTYKGSAPKAKTRNMVTQSPKNGLRCGFPKLLTAQSTEVDDQKLQIAQVETSEITTTNAEEDTIADHFNIFYFKMNNFHYLIDKFLKEKNVEDFIKIRNTIVTNFGNHFASEKDFKENISLGEAGYVTFEYIIWKGYLEHKLCFADKILNSKYTKVFINKFFIRGS